MLTTFNHWFMRVALRFEQNPTPIYRYYGLFAAILSVRLALEFFSNHRLYSFADVVHIGMWFVFIVLAFMLQLHFFSGVPVARTARLVVPCFSFALSAPIIDMLFSGKGVHMSYLSLSGWSDVAWAYITLGGSSLSRGATLGIRIEVALLVVGCFNYVRMKRNSIGWGLVAAWSIYTVLFAAGATSLILHALVQSLGLQYTQDDNSTTLMLVSLNMGLLGIAYLRHRPGLFLRMLQGPGWLGWIAGVLAFGLGAGLATEAYPDNWQLTPTTLFWFPLLLTAAACLAALYSLPQISPALSHTRVRLAATGATLILSIACALISGKLLFVAAVIWGLWQLQYEAPLQLVQVPGLNALLAGAQVPTIALAGFVALGGPMVGFPEKWLGFLLGGALLSATIQRLPPSRQSRAVIIWSMRIALVCLALAFVLVWQRKLL